MSFSDTLKMMYYAQGGVEPLITDGLVCFDPLTALHGTAQVGGQNMVFTSDWGKMQLHGIDCMGTDSSAYQRINIFPDGMPSGNQHFTYAVWSSHQDLPANVNRGLFGRGAYVTSGVPQRFLLLCNKPYNANAITDLRGGINSSASAYYPLDGTWKHNLYTYDGSHFKWYLDGTLVWDYSITVIGIPSTYNLICYHWANITAGFTRLYVFNRALSQSEVTTLAGELHPAA